MLTIISNVMMAVIIWWHPPS